MSSVGANGFGQLNVTNSVGNSGRIEGPTNSLLDLVLVFVSNHKKANLSLFRFLKQP